jgi:hypothetical protein
VTPFRSVFRPESAYPTRTLTSLAMHARRRTGSGILPLIRSPNSDTPDQNRTVPQRAPDGARCHLRYGGTGLCPVLGSPMRVAAAKSPLRQ